MRAIPPGRHGTGVGCARSLLHSPMQILDPSACTCFDEDQPRARATRRRIMGSVADETALMLPAHFPRTGALEIRRDGDDFAVKQWASAH